MEPTISAQLQDLSNKQLDKNFTEFVEALTKLTRKHGVALEAIGGVQFFDPNDQAEQGAFAGYSNDWSSNDLMPHWNESE